MKVKVATSIFAAAALGTGVGLWLARRPLRIARDVWSADRATPLAFADRQQRRLAAFITFARTRSPYYHTLYRNLPGKLADLTALPVVTKPDLMAHFDEWVTDPQVTRAGIEAFMADPGRIGERYLHRYAAWRTSGTTGKPGIFMHDHQAMLLYYALSYLRGVPLMGLLDIHLLWRLVRRGVRVAFIAATGGHFAGAVEIEHWRRRLPWLARRIRFLSVLQPLSTLVRELNAFQPSRIAGYTTALVLLADEQLAGRLHIHPALLTPAGEGLSPSAREKLQRVFDCPVRMTYAASEFPGIGYECTRGEIHVNADWVLLEPVDAAYRPVPPGQPSHTVLLTNLANHLQPLIRYDLGDSITVRPDPCPCGSRFPVIRVEGRIGDILHLQAPSGATISVLPLAVGTVVEETPGVRRAQVIQTGHNILTLRLEGTQGTEGSEVPATPEVWDQVEQRLRDYLATQGVPSVTIVRAPELPQQDPVGGKFRQVWSQVKSQVAAP